MEVSGIQREEASESVLGWPAGVGTSRLGLLDGVGALQLNEDSAARTVSGTGLWGPHNGELRFEDLKELFPPGAVLLYRGPAQRQGSNEPQSEVSLEVEVAGVESRAAWGNRPTGILRLTVSPQPLLPPRR